MLEPQQTSDRGLEAAPHQGSDNVALGLPGFHDDLPGLFDTDRFAAEAPAGPSGPWWRRRGVAIVAAVLLVVVLAGAALAAVRLRRQPVTLQYQAITQGNLTVSVSATGPVQVATYAANFANSGRVAEIDVAVGQQVKAGQVLARLDATQLQDALNQAQAQANEAYDQEQNAIFQCQNERNPPPNCIQQAQDAYAVALAQLRTAQDNLRNATLTAPHAGTVAAINGSVGGAASASGGSGTSGTSGSAGTATANAFIEIADFSSLQVLASVNEADIGSVAVSQAADFTVSAYGSRAFRGSVSQIAPLGQTSSSVVTYPVTIDVDMSALRGAHLLPGMTATVAIITAQRTGVLLIPASAFTFARAAANPTAGGFLARDQVRSATQQARQMLQQLAQQNPTIAQDNPFPAFVLERQGRQWIVKPVVLGLTDGTAYEVLAGLSQSERVVVGEQGGVVGTPGATSGRGGLGGLFGGRGGGAGGSGGGK